MLFLLHYTSGQEENEPEEEIPGHGSHMGSRQESRVWEREEESVQW